MVLYDQYLDELVRVLRTMTIVNHWFGAQHDEAIIATCGLLDSEVHSYMRPYYLRLCGEYSAWDTMMYIASHDTQETIPFTKAALANHPKTQAAYQVGGTAFKALCQRYPYQADLVKCILYPVAVTPDFGDDLSAYEHWRGEMLPGDDPMFVTSLDPGDLGTSFILTKASIASHPVTAAQFYPFPTNAAGRLMSAYPHQKDLIAGMFYPDSPIAAAATARNFELLACDQTILEPYERESIISAVRRKLEAIRIRWNIPEFGYETYFYAMHWCVLYHTIFATMLAQRISNIRTRRVHTYHIWEYLMSCGLADNRDVLTREQSWFLYRNLELLFSNRGSQDNMTEMQAGLLDELNVTLRHKHLVLNTADLENSCTFIPEVISRTVGTLSTAITDLNHGYEAYPDFADRMIEDGLEPIDTDEELERQTNVIVAASATRIPSKVIEIERSDRNRRQLIRYIECLTDTFVSLFSRGLVDYTHTFNFNLVGEMFDLSVGEIFALLHYLTSRETLTTIPTELYVRMVFRSPVPTAEAWAALMPETVYVPGVGDIKLSNILDPAVQYAEIAELPAFVGSADDMISAVDGQYGALVLGDQIAHASAEARVLAAVNEIRYKLLDLDGQFKLIELGEEHPLVPGHTTFATWIAANRQLANVLQYYTVSEDRRTELYERLFNAAFPAANSIYSGGTWIGSEQYNAIKAIFIRMCSYQVAFISTDLSSVEYLTYQMIVTEAGMHEIELPLTIVRNVHIAAAGDDAMDLDPETGEPVAGLDYDAIIEDCLS